MPFDSFSGNTGSEPPLHRVRVSKRARRISLRISPEKGLEVVLPVAADPACVPDVLARHRQWIEKHLKQMPSASAAEQDGLPGMLLPEGGREMIAVVYPNLPAGAVDNSKAALPPALSSMRSLDPACGTTFLIRGATAEQAHKQLKEAVRSLARERLGRQIAALAKEFGFSYGEVRIRFQKRRWGSCTVRGNISLNAALLFLPPRLTRYILLHELCHTRQMNHSERFWKELFRVEPNAVALDKAVRGAWQYVPGCLYR